MKTKVWLLPIALLLVAAVLLSLSTVHAQESWPCDEIVVDRADLFGPQEGQVRDAAEALSDLGADVRVFTVEQTDQGDLDRFVDELWEETCPTWQSADGTAMKANLIIIGVSLEDRLTGIYYGERWFDVLDDHHRRIRDELMNPQFAAGDFAGGFVAGLGEIARLIDLHLHPPLSTAVPTPAPLTPTPVPIAVVETPTPVESDADTTGGGGLIALAIAGGLAVLGGGGTAAGLLLKRQADRRRAQQRAREAKLKVASRLLELQDRVPFLEASIEGLSPQISKPNASALRDQLARVRQLVRQIATDSESIEIAGGDPDREALSVAEYDDIASSYEELLGTLEQAGGQAETIHQRIQALEQTIESLPERLRETKAAIEEARTEVAGRTQASPNRWAESLLDRARAKLEEAVAAGHENRPEEALALAQEAPQVATEAVTAAGLLPDLLARVEEVEAKIDAGAQTFDAIAREYAESSWESIRGNGTEAENRVEWALDAAHQIRDGLASTEEADWTAAQERISEAHAWLDEAVTLIESIEERRRNLEKARQSAPQEIAAAREDVERARSYIEQHDPDIREQLEQDLEAAAANLAAAIAEFEDHEKPDYLQVVTLAQEANEAADKILEEARSEHEAMERLRRKAASVSRTAEADLSRARHYIRVHGSDVGASAKDALRQADRTMAQGREKEREAERREDLARRRALEETISLVQAAGSLAASAYSQAERDFRRAEAARRPTSTPSSTWSGIWGAPRSSPRRGGGSSSSWSRSSSSRRSGGSSSSWSRSSSSRRSGGGSSGWSSSSSSSRRRGGGSSGW